jgi:hypothetical protein
MQSKKQGTPHEITRWMSRFSEAIPPGEQQELPITIIPAYTFHRPPDAVPIEAIRASVVDRHSPYHPYRKIIPKTIGYTLIAANV